MFATFQTSLYFQTPRQNWGDLVVVEVDGELFYLLVPLAFVDKHNGVDTSKEHV